VISRKERKWQKEVNSSCTWLVVPRLPLVTWKYIVISTLLCWQTIPLHLYMENTFKCTDYGWPNNSIISSVSLSHIILYDKFIHFEKSIMLTIRGYKNNGFFYLDAYLCNKLIKHLFIKRICNFEIPVIYIQYSIP